MDELELAKALESFGNDPEAITLVIEWFYKNRYQFRFYDAADISEFRQILIGLEYQGKVVRNVILWIREKHYTIGFSKPFSLIEAKNTSSRKLKKYFKLIIDWIDERPELLI